MESSKGRYSAACASTHLAVFTSPPRSSAYASQHTRHFVRLLLSLSLSLSQAQETSSSLLSARGVSGIFFATDGAGLLAQHIATACFAHLIFCLHSLSSFSNLCTYHTVQAGMGAGVKLAPSRPPLPAPTDSMDDNDDDEETPTKETYKPMASERSRERDYTPKDKARTTTKRADAVESTSFSVPEDGSPITVPIQALLDDGDESIINGRGHRRQKSHTSLLIEYFETSKTGDGKKSKPSVRVKVTPSNKRRAGSASHDAVQITGIDGDRKPSYTRVISLGGGRKDVHSVSLSAPPQDAINPSVSSGSNASSRPQ